MGWYLVQYIDRYIKIIGHWSILIVKSRDDVKTEKVQAMSTNYLGMGS